MSNSLITAFEVVKYSPVRFDYPTATICTAIKNKETTLFRQCLGLEFYDILLDDVINYDCASLYTNATCGDGIEYVEGQVCHDTIAQYDDTMCYQDGDLVLHDGTIFESLVDGNNDPIISAKWRIAPKFENAHYQELWDSYLKYYLAYMIIYTTISYSTFQAGSMGLVNIKNYTEQGQSTVDTKALWNWKANIKQDAIDYLDNMKVYIARNIEYFPELKTFCGISCGIRKKQRIAFR